MVYPRWILLVNRVGCGDGNLVAVVYQHTSSLEQHVGPPMSMRSIQLLDKLFY